MTIHDVAVALAAQAERVCSVLLPGGKRIGQKWVCGDCTGIEGESMAVQLEGPKAGLWFDQSSKEGGDLINLIAANKLVSKGLATKWARDFLGIKDDRSSAPMPVVFDPLTMRWFHKATETWCTGKAAWPYRDAAGKIIAHVVRFEYPNGKKDVLPCRLIDGKWHWRGWAKPDKKPLFNLHRLAQKPDAPILIVEGEKTAMAAAKLFASHVVITWQGGCASVQSADWEHIKGRKSIILWPDADKSGRDAMLYLKSRFPDARMVDTKGLPDGWDLADPVPDGVSIKGLFDGAGDTPKPPPSLPEDAPYRCLGHSDNAYYYLPHRAGYVVRMKAAEHTDLGLQIIAGDKYWNDLGFYQPKSLEVNWKAVAKMLLDKQMATGIYDPSNVRGLGCWLEGDRVVYHAGDHLIVDGERVELLAHKSKWIYPLRPPLKIDMTTIASVDSIKPLMEMSDLLPWQTPGDGWKLVALAFLAPICGVLLFRPNGWIYGESGSGKSFTQANIVIPLIGHCINVKGETTAVGIRQRLGCDSLPVDFDEIEAKDAISNLRIRAICELMRGSSTETGGSILKGSPSGAAQEYSSRSMFIFSSIAMGAIETADENRIVRLEFKKRTNGEAEFIRIKELIDGTSASPAFCQSFVARAITYASRIRAAAEIFGDAIRRASGDARKGQQYGALSAAYWYLLNDGLPSERDAAKFAEGINWNSSETTPESDPGRATDILMQAKAEVLDPEGRVTRLNVGEILDMYYRYSDLRRDAAWDALMRIGIHPIYDRGERIDIALRHSELQKIFKDSQFADRWNDYFKRLEGSETAVFTPKGAKSIRATRIPKESLISPDQPELIT